MFFNFFLGLIRLHHDLGLKSKFVLIKKKKKKKDLSQPPHMWFSELPDLRLSFHNVLAEIAQALRPGGGGSLMLFYSRNMAVSQVFLL